jgi:hypothetical protein
VCSGSPTHTSAASNRIFFLKTKIYAADKGKFFSRVQKVQEMENDAFLRSC